MEGIYTFKFTEEQLWNFIVDYEEYKEEYKDHDLVGNENIDYAFLDTIYLLKIQQDMYREGLIEACELDQIID